MALVDFNNLSPAASDNEEFILDAFDILADLIRRVVLPEACEQQAPYDVECRLYDGWIDVKGGYMSKYRKTVRLLPRLLGLERNVRILPTVAVGLACRPRATLVGTYYKGGQKMVDQMLAQDAIHYAASREYDEIIVVGDDEDYVPSMIALGTAGHAPVRWLRKRTAGRNDLHFADLPITFLHDGIWS
jgi:hypothetical protein